MKVFRLKGDPATPAKTLKQNIERFTRIYSHMFQLYTSIKYSKTELTILKAALIAFFVDTDTYIPSEEYGHAALNIHSDTKQCPTLKAFCNYLTQVQPKYLQGSSALSTFVPSFKSIPKAYVWLELRDIYLMTRKLATHTSSRVPALTHKTKANKLLAKPVNPPVRGFKLISKYTDGQHNNIAYTPSLPQRSTTGSAGYDIRSNEKITVLSRPKALINYIKALIDPSIPNTGNEVKRRYKLLQKALKPTMVHTGIKAYMPKNEVLYMYGRSSNPIKRGLILSNSVGVIDSDYYNNPSNDGELLMSFFNISDHAYTIQQGERVAQCIFTSYKKADNDKPVSHKRQGGWGSSDKKPSKESSKK